MDHSMTIDDDWDEWGESTRRFDEPHEPWPTPTAKELKIRQDYRSAMAEQTLQHRRVTDHGGMAGTGRNILNVLLDRQTHGSRHVVKRRRLSATISKELSVFGEYNSVVRYQSAFLKHLGGQDTVDENGARPASSEAVSTISIAFSNDSQTMASTHGDHTVKISCCSTGRLMETLEGHPRTPWTVKYHPFKNNIVASGCLGFQVRVWDWQKPSCLRMIRLDNAIISLSFHPTGHVLAVASGSRLHFWDYDNHGRRSDQGAVTEVEQRNMLRCVHFPPDGKSIIVGGMNPNQDDPRRGRNRGGMSGGGISFYLRLWDFDLDSALHPEPTAGDPRLPRGAVRLHRKPLANPRTVVPRALLYNDGGFDVSPDGKTLCACAEYWLPDGVDNAMELLNREQAEFAESDAEEADGGTKDVRIDAATAPEVMSPPGRGTSRPTPYLSPPRHRGIRVTIDPPPPPAVPPATIPITPPNPPRSQLPLSPPSPPGRRWARANAAQNATRSRHTYTIDQQPTQGQPVAQPVMNSLPLRPPHPLSVITARATYGDMTRQPGRYVPHVVTVSLETAPVPLHCGVPPQLRGQMTSVAKGYRPRLGQLLEACPLDGAKASAVTCVKFAPSADFCLLGYGVREPASTEGGDSQFHPVTALYRVRGGMTHVSTMLSGDDDVNIARFHPDSGYGFVYGTKQGRVRVLSPRPWNYYNL